MLFYWVHALEEKNGRSLESLFDTFKNNLQHAHFDRATTAKFTQGIKSQTSEAERILSLLEKRSFGQVLDIGCSTGGLSRALSAYSSYVYGIDPEKEAINLSKSIAEYYCNNKVSFVVGSNEGIPFEDSKFDLIVSKTVIEHVSDIPKSISEMKRVLSEDGIAYIEAPNYFWFFETHYKLPFFPFMPRSLFKLMCKMLSKDTEFIDHINFINPGQIEGAFRTEGLEYENVYLKKLRSILVDGEAPTSVFYGWLSPFVKFLAITRIGHLAYFVMAKTGVYPTMAYIVRKGRT